jgi:hypothetical protein
VPGDEIRARKHATARMLEADSDIKNTDNLYNKQNSIGRVELYSRFFYYSTDGV